MKPVPPSMRGRRRYLLARILPYHVNPDSKDLYLSVREAATTLWGDAGAARMQPAVVFCEGGYVIVRCARGTERDLETVIATVTTAGGMRVALRAIATSGTIRSLKQRMRRQTTIREPGTLSIRGKTYTVFHYPRQKLDLVEESIKNQETLFFTQKDLEEI